MPTRKVGPIRHAPWSRRFKTFYCNGWYAHELQVGPFVLQIAHAPSAGFKRWRLWKDRYWRIG